MTATVTKLVYQTGEAKEVLKDRAARPHEGSGIYGAKVYSAATVTFSMPLISEVEITVEAWDYDSSYTVTLTELADGLAFELPDFPAHYTITASFRGSCVHRSSRSPRPAELSGRSAEIEQWHRPD